jgi:hypothetical protein
MDFGKRIEDSRVAILSGLIKGFAAYLNCRDGRLRLCSTPGSLRGSGAYCEIGGFLRWSLIL